HLDRDPRIPAAVTPVSSRTGRRLGFPCSRSARMLAGICPSPGIHHAPADGSRHPASDHPANRVPAGGPGVDGVPPLGPVPAVHAQRLFPEPFHRGFVPPRRAGGGGDAVLRSPRPELVPDARDFGGGLLLRPHLSAISELMVPRRGPRNDWLCFVFSLS